MCAQIRRGSVCLWWNPPNMVPENPVPNSVPAHCVLWACHTKSMLLDKKTEKKTTHFKRSNCFTFSIRILRAASFRIGSKMLNSNCGLSIWFFRSRKMTLVSSHLDLNSFPQFSSTSSCSSSNKYWSNCVGSSSSELAWKVVFFLRFFFV